MFNDSELSFATGEAEEALPILHVDMDAFYVEVERRRNPSLVGKPLVVGGTSVRGVVASASYEARLKGVRSAMSSVQAKRLCPEAIFVSSDFSTYVEASKEIHEVFFSITPFVETISLDEAFLDVRHALRLFGSSESIAWRIKNDVWETVGLDCSVGVANSKLLAKLASVAAKPQITESGVSAGLGVKIVREADERSFLHAHPVRSLWGVGAATFAKLESLGVSSIGDLAQVPVSSLVSVLGVAHGKHLAMLSKGDDSRSVEIKRPTKSISHERTFEVDIHRYEVLKSEIISLSDAVAARLRSKGLVGKTISLKLRLSDFSLVSRSISIKEGTDLSGQISAKVLGLMAKVDFSDGVRLIGIRITGLGTKGPEQLGLDYESFDRTDSNQLASSVTEQKKLAIAVDKIRARFGQSAINPGASGKSFRQPGQQRWG